jgi:hypothetical protein
MLLTKMFGILTLVQESICLLIKNLFVELKESSLGDLVFLGDDRSHEVKGVGTIPIRMPSGGITLIKNVLYVPGLTKNLFSVSVIVDQNMKVKFIEGSCTIQDCKDGRSRVICKGIIDGGLYRLIVGVVDHRALLHDDGTLVELWHRIFGHLNLDSLKKVQKMVRGIPQFNVSKGSVCDACAMGKHHRDPFFSNDEKLLGNLLTLFILMCVDQ